MSTTKILIVEDEQIIAMALEETLISLGYQVIGKAASGEEAIELIQQQLPDLILMDIMLGNGYDGIQTAHIVDQQSHIPVIFLTALSDESTLQSIKAVNPFGYLIKPCDDRELVAAIEVACARQRKELAITAALEKEQVLRGMKTKFTSMMSHEFANALNVISMAHQMLVQTLMTNNYSNEKSYFDPTDLESEQADLLKALESGINQMRRLIQEASKITREEFYGFRFSPQPCDLIQFCESLVKDLNMQYQASHEIDLQIDQSIKDLQARTLILLDLDLLYHILTNLISNAVKYSPIKNRNKSYGTLNPKLSPQKYDKYAPNHDQIKIYGLSHHNQVRFHVAHHDERIVFEIEDHGIGIPPEMLHHLFQPFNRGHNVGKIAGTGLGLALVQQCVDLHQGEIKVTSELNHGTTVTLLLPYDLSSPNDITK